jgi:glycosyltransferase involved in cell wall biosynthesis
MAPPTAHHPRAGGNVPPVRRLSVLMPVYNEEATVATIVGRVTAVRLPLEVELVAVDDGSSDASFSILHALAADEPRLRVVRHRRNLGKGAAVRTAIKHMTGDVAVVQDADLEYNPADIPRLLAPILAGEADAVFGTRFPRGGPRSSPWWHWLVNHFLTEAANVAAGLNLTDMETCYKLVRADLLRQVSLKSRAFTFEPELSCRLAQAGARICEVPISYHYRTWSQGKKIGPRDAFEALAELFRCQALDPCWQRAIPPLRSPELHAKTASHTPQAGRRPACATHD